ncbi:hypothetical protein SAMN05192529_12529 [Arachidicoccus rhizosphaerae]|uniref:Uncharacterized protein n=1 Tax=Arachidicoccus rhizosphaerae TaxID=551991 RepID=A0A1H4BXI8_9BACT|nr:hypothetical protein SAMN05192529_12529 [Arachidicoccus rhizosphaerae]
MIVFLYFSNVFTLLFTIKSNYAVIYGEKRSFVRLKPSSIRGLLN